MSKKTVLTDVKLIQLDDKQWQDFLQLHFKNNAFQLLEIYNDSVCDDRTNLTFLQFIYDYFKLSRPF